ncbi:hypothetical protein D9619_008390 [Psilocybe cf. subviscida]|uniref:Uncharacterized protein n=1 Tax=Psilocybe cf. subviscida TaxID=2480587 RepID=A0A8H5BAB2_9AGAR|nr:hypothetical protein D9619_008390 [Psilocybe cf. subviscida]
MAEVNPRSDFLAARPPWVHNVVRLSTSISQPPCYQMVDLIVHEARLLLNLGDSEEALQVANEALQLARANNLEPMANSLVWALHAVAFTALSYGDHKCALEAAQEGCDVCASSDWQNIEGEHNAFIRPSMLAFRSSAEANLGRCQSALEYAHQAIHTSLDIRHKKLDVLATTSEQSYMETRGNLADILLASGDLAQARQICEERRAYFSKRVDRRMGEYRELVHQ